MRISKKTANKNPDLSKKKGHFLEFDLILSLQVFLTSAIFAILWILQYFNAQGNPNIIGRISFKTEDPPWMPPGQISQSLIGLHHFGDWTLSVGWSMFDNCYDLEKYSCQTPPLGNWILRIFGIFHNHYGYAYVVWLFIALFLYFKLTRVYFDNKTLLQKTVFFTFFILFTSGNIISLDRGSLHFMAFALLGFAFLNYREKKVFNSLIFLTLAVSLKPQLLFCTIYLLRDREIRKFFVASAIPIIINLVLMFTFPGNYLKNLKGYLLASGGYVSSQDAFGNIMNSVSVVGVISRFFEYFNGWDTSGILWQYKSWLIIPGLLYLIVVCLVTVSCKFSEQLKIISALSLISLFVPSSGGYLLGWSTLLMFVMFSKTNEPKDELNKLQQGLVILLILSVNTPGFVLIDSFPGFSRHVPFAVFIPILVLLLICAEISKFRRKAIKN